MKKELSEALVGLSRVSAHMASQIKNLETAQKTQKVEAAQQV